MLWHRESDEWIDNSFSVPQWYFTVPVLKTESGCFCTWVLVSEFLGAVILLRASVNQTISICVWVHLNCTYIS